MRKSIGNNKGITLVALVITVIILIILAAVSFSVLLGNNGLIQKTKDAAISYDKAAIKEAVNLAVLDVKMDGDGKITEEKLRKALNNQIGNDKYTLTSDSETGGWIVTVKDQEFKISSTGDVEQKQANNSESNGGSNGGSNSGSGNSSSTPDFTIRVGDEVTLTHDGITEHFYIIEESGTDENDVVLLAKYCLNQEGTRQVQDFSDKTERKFSSNLYWNNEYLTWLDNNKPDGRTKFNVNNSTQNGTGDAITIARNYATSIGGKNGRLLTYEEVKPILTRVDGQYPDYETAKKISGISNLYRETRGLSYWIASAGNEGTYEYHDYDINDPETSIYAGEAVYLVTGLLSPASFAWYYAPGELWGDYASGYCYPGVRPVVTVAKNRIQRIDTTPNYTLGTEVELTYNNVSDNFYVLSDNGNSLTLLSKYCLEYNSYFNKYTQPYLSYNDSFYDTDYYVTRFSENIYWENECRNITTDTTLNANNISGYGNNSPMKIAKDYATSMGGSNGRLLTNDEIETYLANPSTIDMIYGYSKERAFYSGNDYNSLDPLSYWCSNIDAIVETSSEYNEQTEEYIDVEKVNKYYIYYCYGSLEYEEVYADYPDFYQDARN